MGKKTVSAVKRDRKGKKLSSRDKINVITPEDSEASSDQEMTNNNDTNGEETKIWLPGMELGKDEVLEPDMSVYVMLQEMQMEWPCLSFDTLHDGTGASEKLDFPLEASLVAGTQADRPEKNKIFLMRWSNLRKNQSRDYEDEDAESSDDEDDNENEEGGKNWMPRCHVRTVSHSEGAGINRIRSLQSADASKLVVATWSERGKVFLWDMSQVQSDLNAQIQAQQQQQKVEDTPMIKMKPLFAVDGHREEGYAMDWSRREWGNLLSGDCAGAIYWTQLDGSGGGASVNGQAFTGHAGSVEDLQWSPSESTVFASCSVDQTVRIWDVRCDPRRPVLSAHCHESDVNVISWNKNVSYLLASGADDGSFKTWDLRNFSDMKSNGFESTLSTPVATFKWHIAPITSIEWHPSESSVLAVSGADDQISLWDFAVERDQEQATDSSAGGEGQLLAPNGIPIPPHLLFVHQGQKEVKEIHWHPQSPGVVMSTAASGFNIFKTISI